jgi:hypothetical protein
MTDLAPFLSGLKLSCYEEAFRAFGVENVGDVASLVDEDYDAISETMPVKPFHRKKIATHAAQLAAR